MGKDESGKPKPTRSYQIYIDWASWSKAKRTVVRKELEAARTEAIEAKDKGLKDKARSLSASKMQKIRRSSTLTTIGSSAQL